MNTYPAATVDSRQREPLSRKRLREYVKAPRNPFLGLALYLVRLLKRLFTAIMVLAIVMALSRWPFPLGALIVWISLATGFELLYQALWRLHWLVWRREALASGMKPISAKRLWNLALTPKPRKPRARPLPMPDTPVTLYLAAGPRELAGFTARQWADVPAFDQRTLYLTPSYNHARDMARSWFANQDVGMGFVVKLKIRRGFLACLASETFGRDNAEEYWIPASSLAALNAALIEPPRQAAAIRPSAMEPSAAGAHQGAGA